MTSLAAPAHKADAKSDATQLESGNKSNKRSIGEVDHSTSTSNSKKRASEKLCVPGSDPDVTANRLARLSTGACRIAQDATCYQKANRIICSLKPRVYLEDIDQFTKTVEELGASDPGLCSIKGRVTITCSFARDAACASERPSPRPARHADEATGDKITAKYAMQKMDASVAKMNATLPAQLKENVYNAICKAMHLLRNDDGDSAIDGFMLEPLDAAESEGKPCDVKGVLFSVRLKAGECVRTGDLKRCFGSLEDGLVCGEQDDDDKSKLHIPETPMNAFLRKEQSQTCLTIHKNIQISPVVKLNCAR